MQQFSFNLNLGPIILQQNSACTKKKKKTTILHIFGPIILFLLISQHSFSFSNYSRYIFSQYFLFVYIFLSFWPLFQKYFFFLIFLVQQSKNMRDRTSRIITCQLLLNYVHVDNTILGNTFSLIIHKIYPIHLSTYFSLTCCLLYRHNLNNILIT